LLRAGVDRVLIHNRTLDRAESLALHFGPKVQALAARDVAAALAQTDLLVNTTSAGINGASDLAVPWHALAPNAAVADIVYTPLLTPFLQMARRRGHAIVPGLGMLLHQAVVGFEKWFGVRPEVTQELYDLVAQDIDPDFQP
jgi:shikimate dehydrogenase